MDRRHMLKLATAATLFPDFSRDGFAETPSPAAGADGWISLLNGNDLSGWYSVLQRSGRGAAGTAIVTVSLTYIDHPTSPSLRSVPVQEISRSGVYGRPRTCHLVHLAASQQRGNHLSG